MRTAIISTIHDFKKMINLSEKICRFTHYDIRCVMCCIYYNYVLWKVINTHEKIDSIVKDANEYIKEWYEKNNQEEKQFVKLLKEDNYFLDEKFENHYEEFVYYIRNMYDENKDLTFLDLDNIITNGYVMKCFGVFMWTLKKLSIETNYSKIIDEIINECGDTDTNAAVSGALIGSYIGLEELPKIDIKHKDWIDSIVTENSK